MVLSINIDKYIENSKIRGKLCRWYKSPIFVFITPILANDVCKDDMYLMVRKAVESWNNILSINRVSINFQIVTQPAQADITVHWVKVGRIYEGMCNYVSVINDSIRKISIDIGLPNKFSGKDTTDLSIYCAIMHEFGHALGLGHGVEIDDIMYVPHKKNISVLSENDIHVLKLIYK